MIKNNNLCSEKEAIIRKREENNVDIEKLIEELGKSIGKFIASKKEDSGEKINIDQMDSEDLFKIMFNKFYHEGHYDKAEDLIFKELCTNNSYDIYVIAMEFYSELLKKDDEELIKGKLPRDEIYQGLEDIQKFKPNL